MRPTTEQAVEDVLSQTASSAARHAGTSLHRVPTPDNRRSITMLTPGTKVLSREEALALLEELAEVQGRLDRLRSGIRRLVDDG